MTCSDASALEVICALMLGPSQANLEASGSTFKKKAPSTGLEDCVIQLPYVENVGYHIYGFQLSQPRPVTSNQMSRVSGHDAHNLLD